MALPTLQRKLFKNDGYGPEIKDERLSTDITVKDWDASHDYPANVLAKAGGDIYRSVAASGPGTSAGAVNPTQDASAVYWEVFGKGGSVPVGTVIWLSTSTVPVGFLLCNGQAVGRTLYPDLFGAIGTTYGAGDGSTTFNLPNLIDKFIEGANSNIGDSVAAGLPNITGSAYGDTFDNNNNGASIYWAGSGAISTRIEAANTNVASYKLSKNYVRRSVIELDASNSNSIYGNSSTVQPPAVKLLPCIKAYSDVDNLGSLDVAQLENYVQNNVVHRTGNEVVDGVKTFKKYILTEPLSGNGALDIRLDDVPSGSGPASTTTGGMYVQNVDGQALGMYETNVYAGGDVISRMYAANVKYNAHTTIMCVCTNDGTKVVRPDGNGNHGFGQSDHRWGQIWSTSSTISTSDGRLKTTPESVPDEVLDAWGDVQFVQFKMLESVEKKGGNAARLHNGLIAQRIDEAFKARGLDASRYGLFCWDEWGEEPEERDAKGNVVSEARPAGDMYSLRYEEALCMEAAYQRRRADRAEARISALEARLAALEAKLGA